VQIFPGISSWLHDRNADGVGGAALAFRASGHFDLSFDNRLNQCRKFFFRQIGRHLNFRVNHSAPCVYANLNSAPNQFDRDGVPLLDFEFHTKRPVACNLPLNIEREVTGHRGLYLFQVRDRHLIQCIFGICGCRLAGFGCGDIGCLFRRSIGGFLGFARRGSCSFRPP
jgi:hypothetical protein